MKELVEVVAKALVDNPDEVVVTEKTHFFFLHVYQSFSTERKVGSFQTLSTKAIK